MSHRRLDWSGDATVDRDGLDICRKWKPLIGLAQVNGMEVVHNGDEPGPTETPHTLFVLLLYDYGLPLLRVRIHLLCR
jgi:hypothetical protein